MQWNCPHCGINLAVSDETLGSGWSFSRCYKCGGFALVRRTEINVIKVDKAPPGEKVILPEASGDPTNNLLNEAATKKFAKHTQGKPKTERPNPTQTYAQTSTAIQNALSQAGYSQPPAFNSANSSSSSSGNQQKIGSMDITGTLLPEPLPEITGHSLRSKTVPIGIAVASILAIASGIFLYIQGQALWHKARESAMESHQGPKTAAATVSQKKDSLPAANIIASESGSNDSPKQEQTVASLQKPASSLITDQVQQSAMAPVKNLIAETVAEDKPSQAPHTFMVKLRSGKANLYSGPGITYPIIGTAGSDTQYVVSDWSDRWFKLANRVGTSNVTLGWVRNDLVQVIK